MKITKKELKKMIKEGIQKEGILENTNMYIMIKVDVPAVPDDADVNEEAEKIVKQINVALPELGEVELYAADWSPHTF